MGNNTKNNKTPAILAGVMSGLLLGGCAVAPVAMSPLERAARTEADLQALFGAQEPIGRPIDLYEAMARAIKYNLDHRVRLMEDALSRGQLAAARAEMLPALAVSAGYSRRDSILASSSQSLVPGQPPAPLSTSQDRNLRTADAALVWNVLDFGVSYAQAKQSATGVLVSAEKRRKVIQNIIQDVRFAYWRAVSAERLLPEMDRILKGAQDALGRAKALEKLSLGDPVGYLKYRKELLGIARQMWRLRQQLASAKPELAALLNLPPGQPFQLVAPAQGARNLPELTLPLDQLEGHALAHRPEIREEHYQEQISALEVRKAMLRMLPGLELRAGKYMDLNSFLLHNNWYAFGLNLSWNILNLFTGQHAIDVAEAQVNLDRTRRLSLSMAVLTQVHLATQRYRIARQDYALATDLRSVEDKLSKQATDSAKADRGNDLEVLRARTAALLAHMNEALSYAELQNAYGRIHNSIGLDPLPETLQAEDLETLSASIREQLASWEMKLQQPAG